MSRVLQYGGSGKLSTWFEPSGLQNTIAAQLTNNGWGVNSVNITNAQKVDASSIGVAVLFPPLALATWNYYFTIRINATADANPEEIRQALVSNLASWFTDINLIFTHDTNETVNNTGQTVVTDNNNPNTQSADIWKLLGITNPLTATSNGISLLTLAAIGIGIVLLTQRRR